jgi:hypothetical protein
MLNGKSFPGGEPWQMLDMFYGDEQLAAWQSEILGDDGKVNVEHVSNLLTLSVQIHQWWEYGLCALRPVFVNKAKTEMEIAFHWLPLRDRTQKRSEKVPILKHPYEDQRQGWIDGPSEGQALWHMRTGQTIRSGFIFKVTTTDPETRPLPSWELMSLKWHLSRVAAMQGASEEEDSDIDSDGDSIAVLQAHDRR